MAARLGDPRQAHGRDDRIRPLVPFQSGVDRLGLLVLPGVEIQLRQVVAEAVGRFVFGELPAVLQPRLVQTRQGPFGGLLVRRVARASERADVFFEDTVQPRYEFGPGFRQEAVENPLDVACQLFVATRLLQRDEPGARHGLERLGLLRILLLEPAQKRHDPLGVGVHVVAEMDGVHHADLARILVVRRPPGEFGAALGQPCAVLPIRVQAAADARPHVGFAQPLAGVAVFDGVQHLEVGLQGGVVGAHAKRRRPADLVVGRGRGQVVAALLTILAQPEMRLVDGTVLGIAADEVVDRLNVPLRVSVALVAGVQRFRGLEPEIGGIRGVRRPSVRVQHHIELRNRASVAPLLVQADAEVVFRVGLEHRGVGVVRGQDFFEQRHGLGEPAFLHVGLGFEPRRKRIFLFDEGESFFAVQFGVGQRLGAILPFATDLAQFEQQAEQLPAQGAALLPGCVAAPFGDLLGLLEAGLRQRVRGGWRSVGAFGVATGLIQGVLRLAYHLGGDARLLEQEFEIADRPVELLEFPLTQGTAEQALVLEFGGVFSHRELAESVHGRGQEFVLLLGVLERERADVVEPVEEVERARGYALLAEIGG